MSGSSLVSADWELIDPTPDPLALFTQFNRRFFWGKLDSVVVKWSPRMTSCAGICCYEGHGGLCSISLSAPLLKLRPRKDLVETLLHEMIHAYLFVTQNNRDRDGHGPEFQKHMHRINAEAKTNITIYHTFHNEVKHYKTHVWRCNGPCQHRWPYYGYVRRATNRAPGPNDLWWKDHRARCDGTYQKISEPTEFTQKQQKKKEKEQAKQKKEEARKKSLITNYFTDTSVKSSQGTNNNSGSSSNKKPRFTGVNVLGGNSTPANESTRTMPVRKISGFGDIPVRVSGHSPQLANGNLPPQHVNNRTATAGTKPSTAVLDNSKSYSPSIKTPSTSHNGSAKRDDIRSLISQTKLTGPKTSTNGWTDIKKKIQSVNNTRTPAIKLSTVTGSSNPTSNGYKLPYNATTFVLSDSDDDVPLLTRESPISDRKPASKRKHTSEASSSTKSQAINISDSESDLEDLDYFLGNSTSANGGGPSVGSKGAVKGAWGPSYPVERSCATCGIVLPVEILEDHCDKCIIKIVAATSNVPKMSNTSSVSQDLQVLVTCPVCTQIVSNQHINEHLDSLCDLYV